MAFTQRRKGLSKHWHRMVDADQNSLTATQSLIVSFLPQEGNITETLLRTRGEVLIVGSPNATTDSDVVGLGLIMAHQNAINAGGASLPGLINDGGADWIWYGLFPIDSVGLTVISATTLGSIVRDTTQISPRATVHHCGPPHHSHGPAGAAITDRTGPAVQR